MHYALVFSTSKVKAVNQTAAQWLKRLAGSYAFLNPQNNATWLAPNIAAEVTCIATDDLLSRSILKNRAFLALRESADSAGIDVNLVPAKNRRKSILIADMDSTIITTESLDELAMLAGIGEQVKAITQRSMAGVLDFETALDEDELITAVKLPNPQKSAYVKFPNPASRYAMVGVFVAKFVDGVRVAVTGAGEDGVFRATDIEMALSANFDAASLDSLTMSEDGLMEDIHASPAYRAHLIMEMARRAVNAC